MSDNVLISRRAFAGGAFVLGLERQGRDSRRALPDLARVGNGFAPVVPARLLPFPPITARIRIIASSGGT